MSVIEKISGISFHGWIYNPIDNSIGYSSNDVNYYRVPVSDLSDDDKLSYWNERFESSTVLDDGGYHGWLDICSCLRLNGITS